MAHLALARKHRPKTFEEVVGQEHVTKTLQNAIREDQLAHAYLFSGPRGSGKTTTARLLAKAVNCEHGPTPNPCNECVYCLESLAGSSLDIIEMDAASHTGVDDVRDLQERLAYAPSRARRKVYIVDEVHMLSKSAWNAFLKTLEEPPPHILFIFATTEPEKVLPTILSRCQRFHFRRLSLEEIGTRLGEICRKEGITIDPDAVRLLASRGDGSMRDAETLLDQVSAALSKEVTIEGIRQVLGLADWRMIHRLLEDVLGRRHAEALRHLEESYREGFDLSEIALGLVEGFRNLLFLAVDRELGDRFPVSAEERTSLVTLVESGSTEDFLVLLRQATGLYREVKSSSHPRFSLERGLLELTHHEAQVLISDLLEKLSGGEDTGPGRRARPSKLDVSARAAPAPAEHAAPGAAFPAAPGGMPPRGGAVPPEPKPGTARVAPRASDDAWEGFLRELTRRRAMLGAFLRNGRPTRTGRQALEVHFEPDQEFSVEQLSKPENRRLVSRLYAEMFGENLDFRFLSRGPGTAVVGEGPGSEPPGGAGQPGLSPEQARMLEERPLLGRIIEEFHGRILSDEPRPIPERGAADEES